MLQTVNVWIVKAAAINHNHNPQRRNLIVVKPPHNRRLGLLATALGKQRNQRDEFIILKQVRDELENLMIESGYLDDAPFWWVTVAIRYGVKNAAKAHMQPVNKQYGDLPLAIAIDIQEFPDLSQAARQSRCEQAVLRALIHAGKKYNLQTQKLEDKLDGISGK